MAAAKKPTAPAAPAAPAKNNVYATQLAALDSATDRYIDSLIGEAQGQTDLILKRLDKEHELALGNNDAQTAAFLEKVADGLEAKIGRIPYDYEKYSAQQLQDFTRTKGRLETGNDIALRRLAEDEQVLKEQTETQAAQERQGQNEMLNSRGILTGPRQAAGGIAGREIQDTERDITDRFDAIGRLYGRSREDQQLGFQQESEDLQLGYNRAQDQLTTQARRGAIDQQTSTQFGKQSAQAELDAKKKALERQRAADKLANPTRALVGASY